MQTVKIVREKERLLDGTFGSLECGEFSCSTVERPWLNNEHNVSCIPEGIYMCKISASTTNKAAGMDTAYEVVGVPGRELIKIHVANWPRDVLGCIGLGKTLLEDTYGNRMVTSSILTIQAFYTLMSNKDFVLEITRAA